MAEVRLPTLKHIAPQRQTNPNIPFIFAGDDEYLGGLNEYLQQRCLGQIDPSDVTAPVLQPTRLAFSSSMQCAYFLCDFRTFCETSSAHPNLGVIDILDVRAWHILELYSDAMHRGLWSSSFYERGTVQPLNPTGTVNPRIKENMRAFLWLAAMGYAPDFRLGEDFEAIFASIKESHSEFISKMPVKEDAQKATAPKRNVRRSPGGDIIPSPNHMIDWFNAVPMGTARIGALGIHEHGWRRAETCYQLLLPGCEHTRDRQSLLRLNMWHPRWNDQKLLLKHDVRDHRMIGVLPSREWRESKQTPKFRIIGKGNVIRLIHLKPGWLRRAEIYIDSDRLTRLSRRKDAARPAHLLIDRDGSPLTPGALYKAFQRANKKLNTSLEITPHVLRHIFACRFLQVAIEVEARNIGLEVEDLTKKQIEDFGELALETLRLELGHASVETTRIYIEMLITHWLAPKYHAAWNSVIDAVE